MKYEVGKEYTFGQKEFTVSRETGKLYFIIGENGTGKTYKVSPFEFQNADIPEELICIYREDDRFEQSIGSVLSKVYNVGETYEFKVFRPNPMGMTLRDEVNGLTHNRVVLPQVHVNRYDKINCRVEAIEQGALKLKFVNTGKPVASDCFSASDVIESRFLGSRHVERLAKALFLSPAFAEAREAERGGDSEWIAIAVETVVRYIPRWLSQAPGRRVAWLERMVKSVRSIVESRIFTRSFPKRPDKGFSARDRLVQAMIEVEYYAEAARMVGAGEAGEMIEQTLQSMRETGWLYKPQERMGVMMSVLSLAPRFAHSHIEEIFEVIKTRHVNPKFMSLFGDSFREMLRSYIETQRQQINPADRASLRELAEAIAIELLLVDSERFDLTDRHRGLLYLISTMITGRTQGRSLVMALRTYAGLNDNPLEFSWDDLNDINRVCYHRLEHGGGEIGPGSAVFEGEALRVKVSGKRITVAPAWADTGCKTVFQQTTGGGFTFGVNLPSRLKEHVEETDTNLTHHHLLWNEIRTALHEKGTSVGAIARYEGPHIGTEVEIIVTGVNPLNKYEFECRVVGEKGTDTVGWLPMSEIVPYPVGFNYYGDIFHLEGEPMIFDAIVSDISPEGRVMFSMKKFVMDENYAEARKCMDEDAEILAKVSDIRGKQYKATSEYGFGILISKNTELELNDVVTVKINNVNHRVAEEKLYINADVLFINKPEESAVIAGMIEENFLDYNRGCLHELLQFLCNDRVYHTPVELLEEEENFEDDSDAIYLPPAAMTDISKLLEYCAELRGSDLVGCYTDLSAAWLLSTAAGDKLQTATVDLKKRLQERISIFAKDGRLDLEASEELLAECGDAKNVSHDMAAKMSIVSILTGLDNEAFFSRAVDASEFADNEQLQRLYKLASAYNNLEGLGIPSVRADLKKKIFEHLSLPSPNFDQKRLTVSEDLYHEFKSSLIFPAGKSMIANERQQGEVIVAAIAAFLNTDGGTLYLGVDDHGYPRGLAQDFRYLNHGHEDFDEREMKDKFNLMLMAHLRRLIGVTVDGLSLFPDYLKVEYEEIDSEWICRVIVRPFPGTVLFKDGRLFIRRPNEKCEVRDPREIRRFIERRAER